MSEGFVDPYVACPRDMQVVLPGPNELQLDIDDPADLDRVQKLLDEVVGGKADAHITRTVPSRTPGHVHVYVHFALQNDAQLTPEVRIALQACLGSDRSRELLSILAVALEMDYEPTVFFEPKVTT